MELRTKPMSEQVALVTGGGTGIGRAFAGALSAARVCIASVVKVRDGAECGAPNVTLPARSE